MIRVLLLLLSDELGFGLGLILVVDMGCGGSKADELPLVILSRERKELIKAASDHRYALAAAHVAYFSSLKDVGDALRRFVDEEIVIASSSASADSPVLTLPSDQGKKSKNKKRNTKTNHDNDSNNNSSSTSLSHSSSISHNHVEDDGDSENSHIHLSSDSELDSDSGHIRIHDDSPEVEKRNYSPPNRRARGSYGVNPTPQTDWGSYGMNPPPQTDWGSYGFNPPPQTNWGSYEPNPPPQTNWGSYESNQPPQTNWGSYESNPPPQTAWGSYGGSSNTYAYYMKKSAPAIRTVIHEEPRMSMEAGQWSGQSYGYSNYPNENGGFFGMSMSSLPVEAKRQPTPPAGPPPPPSPPKVSAWDFLNPFDVYDSGYPGYYSQGKYSYGSIASSPDSNEVREREGIPDLEEETENEVIREVHKGKNLNEDRRRNLHQGTPRAAVPRPPQNSDELRKSNRNSDELRKSNRFEGTSRAVPPRNGEGSSRAVYSHTSEGSSEALPSQNSEETSGAGQSDNSETAQYVNVNVKGEKSSTDTIVSSSTEEGYVKKKGVSFEVEDILAHDVESSQLSSLTALSAHGTRDLQEVVTEIRDEFEVASSYGKEVAVMLEVGKVPYQPKFTVLKVIISRILYLIAPSLSSSYPPSRSVRLTSRTMKIARSYYEDTGKGIKLKPINLSSTLEKLYAWEKKLHKEIKDEERLRVIYEKMCKRLKILDERGAESSKIDATRASVRRLLTKLDVCINTIDAISSRIHKLRDEELQPQVSELIHGLIRMWKSMLKCHHKQFQAIKESKTQTLKANTGFRTDSSLRATRELEVELLTWCSHFNDWINAQKSYVESLNGWLLRCLNHEPEETPDGIAPFSPGRIGAPPIFVICNDWSQAMETVSESGVKRAMQSFASDIRRLYERQDDEHRQRLKAEYLSKDFEKRMTRLRAERGKMKMDHNHDTDKTGGSIVTSENGVSPLDDLKVDLDSIRKKLEEERIRHKDAIKLVHDAASSSLQGSLVPIFKSLENFTSEALKAHEQVRIQKAARGS
ncbi:hypothetical protein LguiB_009965 [Lonicera macranthoides]